MSCQATSRGSDTAQVDVTGPCTRFETRTLKNGRGRYRTLDRADRQTTLQRRARHHGIGAWLFDDIQPPPRFFTSPTPLFASAPCVSFRFCLAVSSVTC